MSDAAPAKESPMFGHTWRVGRIAGVELRIDSSWVIIAVIIAYSFYARLEALHDELPTSGAAALAVISAIAFFGSVLLHELAHAVAARLRGIPVKGITLFLFGGATEAKVESKEPKDEFLITIVGPLTSAFLGAGLGLVAAAVGDASDPIPGSIGYLAWVNLALAAFNLLPGLPLDGGRVLRSLTWAATNDLHRATRVAARAGQILGYSLIGFGFLTLLAGALGGLWLAFIGWFLAQAAQASYLELQVSRMLRGVTAGDVMARDLISIPGDTSIDGAINEYFLRYDHGAFPVDVDGQLRGVLTLRTVRRLPADERTERRAADCMRPLERAATVEPDTRLSDVVSRFHDDDEVQRVLVVNEGEIAGIVTPTDVARWLRRSEELGLTRGRRRSSRAIDLVDGSTWQPANQSGGRPRG